MYLERHTVSLLTSSGAATGYTPNVTGRVVSIQYVKTDFADGVDVDITGDATGLIVWNDDDVNAAITVYPLQAAALGADGAASTLSEVPIALVNERVKIVVANGGDAKTGVFHVIVER